MRSILGWAVVTATSALAAGSLNPGPWRGAAMVAAWCCVAMLLTVIVRRLRA